MFESLAKALAAGLSLWESKEKTKYQDKLMNLRRDYREEFNKPVGERSNAVLDNLKFELCLLGNSFSSSVGAADPVSKP